MKYVLILSSLLFATAATAHPGHLTDAAGHDHWLAAGALASAAVIALTVVFASVRKSASTAQSQRAGSESDASHEV